MNVKNWNLILLLLGNYCVGFRHGIWLNLFGFRPNLKYLQIIHLQYDQKREFHEICTKSFQFFVVFILQWDNQVTSVTHLFGLHLNLVPFNRTLNDEFPLDLNSFSECFFISREELLYREHYVTWANYSYTKPLHHHTHVKDLTSKVSRHHNH